MAASAWRIEGNDGQLKVTPPMERDALDDKALIDLLTATANHYRQELDGQTCDPTQLRMEILRRLELISHSLKGLLKGQQLPIFRP